MKDEKKLIWGTIANIARVYLFGYNLTNPNQGMGNVMRDLRQSLPALLNSIKEIESNVIQIQNAINKLDVVIRGEINTAHVKVAMSKCRTKVNQLSALMKNETAISLNQDTIINVSLALEQEIRLILDLTDSSDGKVSGLFLTAPFYSIFAKGYTYGMRQRWISNGVDPKLAPNAFGNPMTKEMLTFSKKLISKYKIDYTNSLPFKNSVDPIIKYSGYPKELWRFDTQKEFTKASGIQHWPASGLGRDESWRRINSHRDHKFKHLYWARLTNSKKVQFFATRWAVYAMNSNLKGYTFRGVSINSPGHDNDDRAASDYAKKIHKAKIFFEQTGDFFNGFSDFENAIKVIENSTWEPKELN